MLLIAICDDQKRIREYLAKLVLDCVHAENTCKLLKQKVFIEEFRLSISYMQKMMQGRLYFIPKMKNLYFMKKWKYWKIN